MKVIVGGGIVDQLRNRPKTSRRLKNLLGAYLQFTENQEASELLHMWTFISTVSGVMQRRVYLDRGHYRIFPNLYILIVGEPGLVKKSTSTAIGVNLLREIEGIHMLAERITDASLIDSMSRSLERFVDNKGKEERQSAVFAYASELSVFMKETFGVVTDLLTTFFDCYPYKAEKPWIKESKVSGEVKIYGPCLSLLGCTTPSSLLECIPLAHMEGGFASRVLFVYDPKPPTKFIPIPKRDKALDKMEEDILNELKHLATLSGEMAMTTEAEEVYSLWYVELKKFLIEKKYSSKFSGYYGRKAVMVEKLSMVLSVIESDDLLIKPHHIKEAVKILESLEQGMKQLFKHTGRNPLAGHISDVLEKIKQTGQISHAALLKDCMYMLDTMEFDHVLRSLQQMGCVQLVNMGGKVGYKFLTNIEETKKPTGPLEISTGHIFDAPTVLPASPPENEFVIESRRHPAESHTETLSSTQPTEPQTA